MSTNNKFVSIVDVDLHVAKLFHEALSQNIEGVRVLSFTDPVIALEHFSDNKDAYALVIAVIGLVLMQYAQAIFKLPEIPFAYQTPDSYFESKLILTYCFGHADRPNPVQD